MRYKALVTIFILFFMSIACNPRISSVEDLIETMKEKNDESWFKSFTFSQETIVYDSLGVAGEPSIWEEAIIYPDKFRIDYDLDNNHYIFFKEDSSYHFRSDTLFRIRYEPQEFLLFKGGLYFMNTSQVLERLRKYNVNAESFLKDKLNGKSVFIVGDDEKKFWIDEGSLKVQKRQYIDANLDTIVVKYGDFIPLGNGTIETTVEFYRNSFLIQKERYFDIQLAAEEEINHLFDL